MLRAKERPVVLVAVFPSSEQGFFGWHKSSYAFPLLHIDTEWIPKKSNKQTIIAASKAKHTDLRSFVGYTQK